jgi:predicted dehydrogenase
VTVRAPQHALGGSPLRVGLVGTGFIGGVHAHAARVAGAELRRVAGSSPESSARAADRLGGAPGTAEEVVTADDVDVVHICTPNHLHAPLAELALRAGKHVVCEKPLATTAADAERLVALAAAAGVVTAVPFVYRYYATVRDARARVARGETGPLWLLHGSYLQDWMSDRGDTNWRVDAALGGASRAFADIGVHWCDLVEFTSGHRLTRLTARTSRAVPDRGGPVATEDAATILFETDRGALGSLVVSQITPGRKNRLWFSLDGPDASLAFDQELPESLWLGTREHAMVIPRGSGTTPGSAQAYSFLPAGHPQGYQDCFDAFVGEAYAAVRGEDPAGLPTFTDGLRAARITDAVLGSAVEGAWTEVPDDGAGERAHRDRPDPDRAGGRVRGEAGDVG